MNAQAQGVDDRLVKVGTAVRVISVDESDVDDGMEVGDTGVIADHEHDTQNNDDIVYVHFDCGIHKWMNTDQLEALDHDAIAGGRDHG
jgi:hypothetical protein